jgi:hypothetical protein
MITIEAAMETPLSHVIRELALKQLELLLQLIASAAARK